MTETMAQWEQEEIAEPATFSPPAAHQSQNLSHPINPWQQSSFEMYRERIRFAVWNLGMINVLMVALFVACFTYQFFTHLWSLLSRTLFSGAW